MPKVVRRLSQVDGGYQLDYVISNEGIDERGIPGVRIASVEGLLVETDQFGRYNLVGIESGRDDRGRNFILKVDPATLPPGTVFTTSNPLVRRITPGLPVRFDFGVKLPVTVLKGNGQAVEMELGQVMFEAGSAQVRPQYAAAVEQIASRIQAHGGGDIAIAAHGEDELLAFERAIAVRDAVVQLLDAQTAAHTQVSLRTQTTSPELLVAVSGTTLLGNVLFETDKAEIQSRYRPLLGRIARYLSEMDVPQVQVIGHADLRGSAAYNQALGMKRANAVYQAIVADLPAQARKQLRVEYLQGNAATEVERGSQGGAP